MTKAYSYLRFSTPEQSQGDSRRRQSSMAAKYAAEHGLELDDALTFSDLGISAFRGRNATKGALRAFLDLVDEGAIEQGSVLLVESLDRVSRDQILDAQGLFLQIVQAGVTLVTLSDNRAYSAASINANPTDLIISLLSMMRAHEESAMKSKRLSAAWDAKRSAATTKPLTAVCPAWLRLDRASGTFEVIEDRAAIVRRIFAETLSGIGQNTITRRLNEQAIPVFGEGKRQGARWHRSYVAKLLCNPAVVGTLTPHRVEYDGKIKRRRPLTPIPGYYPAVVTPETFDRVQALSEQTANPMRGRHAARPVANILGGGLGRCGLCGEAMTLSVKSRHWRYLVCSHAKAGAGCEYRALRYPELETAFLDQIPRILSECPAPDDGGLEARTANLEAALDAERDDLNELLNALTGPAKGSLAVMERIRAKEAAISSNEAELRALADQRFRALGVSLNARLQALAAATETQPIDRTAINAALRVLLSAVIIDPKQGWAALDWRHGGTSQLYVFWPENAAAVDS